MSGAFFPAFLPPLAGSDPTLLGQFQLHSDSFQPELFLAGFFLGFRHLGLFFLKFAEGVLKVADILLQVLVGSLHFFEISFQLGLFLFPPLAGGDPTVLGQFQLSIFCLKLRPGLLPRLVGGFELGF